MDSPIRVLHVVSSMNLGGIQSLLMNLYRHIDREKVQFDFAVHTNGQDFFTQEIIALGGKIYSFPRFTYKNVFAYIKRWKQFLGEHEEYKIIHGHIRSTASIYLCIAKKMNRFTIAHSHSTFREPGIEGIAKYILEYPLRFIPDDWFACSSEAAEVLFGKNTAIKTKIIRNAIDVERFTFDINLRTSVRQENEILDNLVVGTVGRIEKPKNPIFIVDVVKQLIELDEKVKFLWVGTGSLMDTVKKYAAELGCEDSIIFVGATAETERYLNAMDVFIMPSLDEGFGIAAIEAECAGLPVIVSTHVPKSACITPTTKSISLKEDSKKWAEECLIASKEVAREEVYHNAADDIRDAGFSIEAEANRLCDYYLSLNGEYQ